MPDLNLLTNIAIKASLIAGKEIIEVYKSSDFKITSKSDDTPLTLADRKAHDVIIGMLAETNLPVLSEEGAEIPYAVRKEWTYFWLVDPLDGTKEFINRNGEFTVNIALIYKNLPILGVIYVPVTKDLYFGNKDIGAFKAINVDSGLQFEYLESLLQMSFRLPFFIDDEVITVVASKSHLTKETSYYIEELKKNK